MQTQHPNGIRHRHATLRRMPADALEEAASAIRGLNLPNGKAHPLDPAAGTRRSTQDLICDLPDHPSLTAWVHPLARWIGGGAAGGILVEWNPDELDVHAYQTRLCQGILTAKCTGNTNGISEYWSPSFLLHHGRLHLLDGHHAFALTHLAHQAGVLRETPTAYVHLRSPYGATGTPHLDCNCLRRQEFTMAQESNEARQAFSTYGHLYHVARDSGDAQYARTTASGKNDAARCGTPSPRRMSVSTAPATSFSSGSNSGYAVVIKPSSASRHASTLTTMSASDTPRTSRVKFDSRGEFNATV